MADSIIVAAHAKVNLSLDVTGLRADGYHDIVSVMAQLQLHDRLKLTTCAHRISISTSDSTLPVDNRNLAWQAAEALRQYAGRDDGVHISIDKRIPTTAGLGGGSADAAAVLLGLNCLWRLDLGVQELAEIGARIGSDVPFCVHGGCALVTGRGEIVQDLPHRPISWVVLARPPHSALSSRVIYQRYDTLTGQEQPPHTSQVLAALAIADWQALATAMGNHLEKAAVAVEPAIGDVKRFLTSNGSGGACVSGSGPTIVALVGSREQGAALVSQTLRSGLAQALLTQFRYQLNGE